MPTITARRPPRTATRVESSFEYVFLFLIFFIAHLVSALYSPIQDCDEVFNYWEPTHYLNHGYGMQTWEYSPVYAIRSWLYIGLHAIIIAVGRLLPFISKTAEFYFLRVTLACVCAICETTFFNIIAKTLNRRIAYFFTIIVIFSPGTFHAVTAYLPSTFAMYCNMLGVAAFMNWRGGLRTAQGIFWFAIGGIWGWPFASVLALPFFIEELCLAFANGALIGLLLRCSDGVMKSAIALVMEVAVSSFFYKKFVCVPLNIVFYNVFSSHSKGPNIFGTEPWHFYFRNLLINFNFWFILALLALPLLILQRWTQPQEKNKRYSRSLVFISPFYLWFIIFTLQPHKEERFMYPVYPLLALNAAISLHILLSSFGSARGTNIIHSIPPSLKLAMVSTFILSAISLGLWRIAGAATAYGAPLKVYSPLSEPGMTSAGDTVCLGKEWYRFPSSYFLPDGVRAKFVQSDFRGLLPGEFPEASQMLGAMYRASAIPLGMNDENREDPTKYVNISQCSFLIDRQVHQEQASELEPDYALATEQWETVLCAPFLDAASTTFIGRLGWLPDSPQIPERFRRKWQHYCLLRSKTQGLDER